MTLTATAWGLDSHGDDWRLQAACASHDPDWWVVVTPTDEAGFANNERARRICTTCPVRRSCADAHPDGLIGMIVAGRSRPAAPKQAYTIVGAVKTAVCGLCESPYVVASNCQRYCSSRCAEAVKRQRARQARQAARA